MLPPTQSYRIWKTQRSGSTLLYKALTDTRIAGIPGEHFYHFPEAPTNIPADPYDAFKQRLWTAGSTPNGVFGVNHDFHGKYYRPLFEQLLHVSGWTGALDNHEAIWADIFPRCQHIYLTRRDKVRQAISWWRAIQDNVWHLTQTDTPPVHTPEFYEENYNLAALQTLMNQLMLKEVATQEYFQAHDIIPLTIVYEDFIADYEGTIQRVLSYLGLYEPNMSIPAMYYQPTYDAHSELWVERLRHDLQGDDHEEWVWRTWQ